MANPACVAYEAYRVSRNSDPKNTVYLIGWQYLPKEERDAWWAVVRSLTEINGATMLAKGGA